MLIAVCLLLTAAMGSALATEATPASFTPVEGRDYVTIADGAPYQSVGSGVEVAEVFSYRCVHCARFAPVLDTWKRRQARDVRLVYVPLPYSGDDMLARGFFAASDAGALGRTHAGVFRAIHNDAQLPSNPSADEMAAHYASAGLDGQAIRSAMTGDAMQARLMAAYRFAMASGVDSTPTLIVDGRYRVLGQPSFEQTLRVVDALIARVRDNASATP